MLCEVCLNAFPSAGPIPWTAPEDANYSTSGNYFETQFVPHHSTLLSLKESVDSGCLICATFWNFQAAPAIAKQLELEASLSNTEPLDLDLIRPGTQLGILIVIRFHPGLADGSRYTIQQAIRVDGYSKDMLQEFSLGISLLLKPKDFLESENIMQCSTNLASPETLSQAKHWIKDCIEHHPSCGSLSTWQPTRLLDSGPLDLTNDHIVIYLHETSIPASVTKDPYMTLSYCWGQTAPLTLTRETYPILLAGIPLQNMPQAFRDAIIICRGLGIRYLWIDALCIFQDKDDLSDWHREACQMHMIYSNSFCTISASVGESSSSPILWLRSPDTLRQDELKVTWKNKDSTITTSTYFIYTEWLWHNKVLKAPVNQRGWVLQERMLSPRVLLFADTQMFWDCFQKRACETYPHGWLGRRIHTDYDPKSSPYTDYDRNKTDRKKSIRKLHEQWRHLVQIYSACRLTFPADRLIAISAILRRFASYFGDDCLAGMWRQSLQSDLLWKVLSPDPNPPDSTFYIAPSWSWASTNSGVSFFEEWPPADDVKQFAFVEDVQLEYTSDGDHFGSLQGGRLQLRGVLQRIQLLALSKSLTIEETTIGVNTDIEHSHNVIINEIPIEHQPLEDDSTDVYLDRHPCRGFEKQNSDAVLFCMLLSRYSSDPHSQLWRLLLLEVVNATEGTFRRLGVMSLSWRLDLKTAALSRHSDEACFPCIKYEDLKHSIWII